MSTDSTEISVTTRPTDIEEETTLRTLLLDGGFIRRIPSEGRPRYEVTGPGLQYIADYEHIELDSRDISNHTKLKMQAPVLTSKAIDLLRDIDAESLSDAWILPREGVSIFIPTLNEAENIRILLEKIPSILHEMPEIIVIDGGSADGTVSVANSLGAKVITQKGTGKGDAMRQLFAGNFEGQIVVMMDADGSNRIEEIPRLVDAIVNGADIAKGSRFLKGGGSTDLSWVRKIGNKFFVSMVNLFWPGQYTDLCYGFMAFKKDALARLAPLLESARFQIETEICIDARKLGLHVVEIPTFELKRLHGVSNLRGFHDSVSILRTILRELFASPRPA